MDEHACRVLEFDQLRDYVMAQAATPFGRDWLAGLGPIPDRRALEEALHAVEEVRGILESDEAPSLTPAPEVRPALARARIQGACLDAVELLRIRDILATVEKLRRFWRERKGHAPITWEIAQRLIPQPALVAKIGDAIGPDGSVLDGASAALGRLRREIRHLRETIVGRLESVLAQPDCRRVITEPIITLRNDRYVIPVRPDFRTCLQGVVQDQSQSGQTLFLEPAPVVGMNNRLRSLEREEAEEVRKILVAITTLVGAVAGPFEENLGVLGALDGTVAKAQLGMALGAATPRITEDGHLILRQARHPFLWLQANARAQDPGRPTAVVPIDIEVGGSFSVLVITGPNTGGKTVALKTVGLLALMVRSGLQIPASADSQVPFYGAIFADIGDEQSIAQSLSTFSSHMTQVVQVLNRANGRSLVLLDELGAGTDPSEGAALGMAILEALQSRGAQVVATTHLESVKAFAAQTAGMQNACVEFDVEALRPLHRVHLGLPGRSYGIEIAGRLGLAGEVLERARGYVSEEGQRLETLLEHLEGERHATAEGRARLEGERRVFEGRAAELAGLERILRAELAALRHEAEARVKEIVAQVRKEGDALIQDLRRGQGTREAARRFQEGIRELGHGAAADLPFGEALPTAEVETPVLAAGWIVHSRRFGQQGRVLSGPSSEGRDGTVEVELPLGRVRLPAVDLVVMQERPPEPAPKPVMLSVEHQARLELDLRGTRVESALETMDKYLDAALVAGLRQVRIIHGKGTGSLRRAVHGALMAHPQVTRFSLADQVEGGRGATVVELSEG